MSEKTILITGATSGIGLDTALYLHEMGYKLLLIGRNEAKLRDVSEKTGNSLYYVIDLEYTERISEISEYCKANSIRLNGMVHSAGCSIVALIRNYSLSNAEKQMRLHYYAFIELCKCLYSKRILNDSASIVALSSISSVCQGKGSTMYAASKSALNSAVTIIAQEFAKKKIRVNALMPAYVDTRMTDSVDNFIDISTVQSFGMIPPRDIAYSIEFLLSDKSRYITGALIPITAGMMY